MEEESWKRNHGRGIIKEQSWRGNHGGGIMEEAPRRHPGGTQEAPRRHPGDTQEAPRRHPEAPKAPRRLQELLDTKSDTPLSYFKLFCS